MKLSTILSKNKSRNERTLTLITYCVLLFVSFSFMLMFSLWISPVYKNWYGCDASFFTLVGRGILEGKVPYRDFYDLKGPYFFFIEALGQLICKGHLGILLLEIIALFASLLFVYRISRLYINHRKTLILILFFILNYIALIWGGNCLEEFALPINLLVIYLSLGYIDKTTNKNCFVLIPYSSKLRSNINVIALITGISFSIMAFSKITVAAPLVGMVIAIFIILLVRKEYKTLAFYIIYFLLGGLLAILPLLIYFGINESILQMLHCVFVFALKRSEDYRKNLTLNLEFKLSGLIFAMLFSILHSPCFSIGMRWLRSRQRPDSSLFSYFDLHYRKNKKRSLSYEQALILFLMALISYVVLHLGDSFIYYFITGMPCILLALILFVKIYNPFVLFYNLRQTLCFILVIVYIFHYTPESIGTVKTFINRYDDSFQNEYYENAINMGLLIPEYDRDSVFSFDIDMQWFEINNITPCNKYVVNLQYFIALEPNIEGELFDYFESNPPKWMICSNTLADYLPQMENMVNEKYDCLYVTDIGRVFLLKEKHP